MQERKMQERRATQMRERKARRMRAAVNDPAPVKWEEDDERIFVEGRITGLREMIEHLEEWKNFYSVATDQQMESHGLEGERRELLMEDAEETIAAAKRLVSSYETVLEDIDDLGWKMTMMPGQEE